MTDNRAYITDNMVKNVEGASGAGEVMAFTEGVLLMLVTEIKLVDEAVNSGKKNR
jgi:hypothetical protein